MQIKEKENYIEKVLKLSLNIQRVMSINANTTSDIMIGCQDGKNILGGLVYQNQSIFEEHFKDVECQTTEFDQVKELNNIINNLKYQLNTNYQEFQ